MSAKSERPKNRRVKLVGGGYKWTRDRSGASGTGGSLKAQRRKLRQQAKNLRGRKETVAQRKEIKQRIAELLASKDGR